MSELMQGTYICQNCHTCVKYAYTPGGIQYCPNCNYSPKLNGSLIGTTSPYGVPNIPHHDINDHRPQ